MSRDVSDGEERGVSHWSSGENVRKRSWRAAGIGEAAHESKRWSDRLVILSPSSVSVTSVSEGPRGHSAIQRQSLKRKSDSEEECGQPQKKSRGCVSPAGPDCPGPCGTTSSLLPSYVSSDPATSPGDLGPLKLPNSVFSAETDSGREKSSSRESHTRNTTQHTEHSCDGLPYIQGRLLGEGGFGSVYAGNRISDGLKVAIKYVSKDLIDKQLEMEGKGPMPIEVALMIRVNSDPTCPNILHLIEWFETDTQYIMILERPDPCQDLDDYCYEQGNLEENQARRVLVQLIGALKHCQKMGVVHRDVKPQNILIRKDTHDIKLLDFGCGDLLKESAYTKFSGTPIYFPPEWYLHSRYHAGPATVWSVGVTLYELLCGKLPFRDKKEIIRGKLQLPRHLSKGCRSFIRWCLETTEDMRPTLEDLEQHPWLQ